MVTPAMAADMYASSSLKDAPVVAAPITTWTGFYLGGNAGGGWATLDSDNNTAFVGGGQIGYNYQTGQFVFGVESDIDVWVSTKAGANTDPLLADVTGRLGYAMGPVLLYAKGGWAYLDTLNGLDGWTVGGGVEYKFGPSWSMKGEYQHFDFSNVPGTSSSLTAEVVKVGLNYHFANSYVPLK